MRPIWVIALAGYVLSAAALPSVDGIVRRSVANTQTDWNAAPGYNFTERDVITGRPNKTYRVRTIDGSPYNELVATNGEPLTAARTQAEARKLQQEIAKRQGETPGQRQERVARYAQERRQDNELLQQMIKAMDFQLSGEEAVDGRKCFVLEGTPRPDYQPPNRETKVLKGMRGKMWIDERTYQWVKVEAEIFRPVTFGLFIARVEPGTKFTLEQKPLSGNLWLPSHFSVRVNAKVLGFWSHNSSGDETYSDYSKAQVSELSSAPPRGD